ncbi:hypothetical protein ZYGR_0AG04000 [Zygosaccharomyces rouxii]|uniref:MICOS complex subunit MIC27 n=1 Tax=Zygosaccharomyces rouxii TaxID=4956 RepID=A0A1Q3A9H7_ZYGRO|nr:hypothetical protein ZYGR_0AG04000 [Zygosaccharomyces rouxii]
MNRFFYSSPEEIEAKQPEDHLNNQEPRFQSELLSNGNQVIQSPPLTERIHDWRNSLIHQYNSIVAELSNLKSATGNEIYSGREYIYQNVFNDSHENNQLIVPSAILSLGAFFCGRVLTNKNNWGYRSIVNRNPSILGRILTSLPSRIVLPLALTGIVFDQLTPGTAGNAWNTFERDFLSESFIQESHRIWDQLYVRGIKQGSGELGKTFQNGLQNGIKSIRESITEITGDRKQ